MTETNPQNRRLGYARVSTYGQTLDAQLEQLRADGCAKVYREKASGAQADRRELLRMLKDVMPGDVVTVTRIDRLARSTFDLFATVKRIVDAGGQFRSLAEPWADTATSGGLHCTRQLRCQMMFLPPRLAVSHVAARHGTPDRAL
jgi:DNA invertase Pin-like site-specific DNA recombinase